MKKSIRLLFLGLILSVSILISCSNDDNNSSSATTAQRNTELLNETLSILGGEAAITSATHISFDIIGKAMEWQEEPEPIEGIVADYTSNLIYNLDGTQSKQSWNVDANYAYFTDFAFTETIDNKNGKSEGETGTFPAHFQSFGVVGDPMYSTKLAARQKTLMLSNPLAMLKMIRANGTVESSSTYGTISSGYNTSSLGFGANTPDLELIIDTASKLPLRAQVLENDPLLGDVLLVVNYSDWKTKNGIQYPHQLNYTLDGLNLRSESLDNITINPIINAETLTVNDEDTYTYDANQARYGYLSSQFHYRTILQTFPIDFPVEVVNSLFNGSVPSKVLPTDPNAYLVAGSFQSHYTFAFKVDGSVVIYDSPVNDRRSAAVLNKIRADFSTDPISHVVNSHNHFDHIGGVRGNLAEGGDLVVGTSSKAFMEGVLARPKTILGNPIAGKTINITGLEDEMIIGSGDQEIRLYTIETSHTEHDDYIVLYKPATKTIYFNDLVNPGFVFVWDAFNSENQERMIHLAKSIVDFVDAKGLDVKTYYCTHGFTLEDSDFNTVRALAAGNI